MIVERIAALTNVVNGFCRATLPSTPILQRAEKPATNRRMKKNGLKGLGNLYELLRLKRRTSYQTTTYAILCKNIARIGWVTTPTIEHRDLFMPTQFALGNNARTHPTSIFRCGRFTSTYCPNGFISDYNVLPFFSRKMEHTSFKLSFANSFLLTSFTLGKTFTDTEHNLKTICKREVNLFFENSTRTRLSFELAEKRLSADVINFSASQSSVTKGETLVDTVNNILSMKVDMVVMRHPNPGAGVFLSQHVKAAIVNAGDGAHEHPTQALLDSYSIRERLGDVAGKKVVIVGDILHSRVALSNIFALHKQGAEVMVCGPKTLIPKYIHELGVKVETNLRKALN